MANHSLTLQAAKSTQVAQVDRVLVGNEERGATGGSPLSINSTLFSMSSGYTIIDLTQDMLDEEEGKTKE